jgi:lipopolysaccharide export system permease protein
MPKTIYRSVLAELGAAFLLTVAFLNAVLMMEKILRLSAVLAGVGATIFDMARMIVLIQPQLLILTIPMSLLLSTLLVYGRMSFDSEIVILRASGMDFLGITVPVAVLGIACFLISLSVSFYIGPRSATKLRDEMTRIVSVRSSLAIDEGSFSTPIKDVVLLVKSKSDSGSLRDIFIYDSRNREEPKVLTAKEGDISLRDGLNLFLQLRDGCITMTKGSNTTDLFFDRYQFALRIDIDQPDRKKIELTPFEIMSAMKEQGSARERTKLLLELHRRFSLPVVCLVLIFLAPPLSQLAGKSGRLGGLAIGLAVFSVYYVLLIYGENLVTASKFPPYAGAWMSTIVLAVCSVLLYRRELSR